MLGRDTIVEVISDSLEKEIPELVPRELSVPLDLKIKRAISIVGPRRAGKTFYMFYLMKKIKKNVLYLNFEDYRLLGITYKELAKIIEVYYEMFPENRRRKVFFFFDEIQNVERWEKIVRSLLDNENVQIFITGSSSKLLSKEISTELRGRTLSYEIFPFSFREFIIASKFEIGKHLTSYKKAKLKNLLEEYLRFGGYPETLFFEDKKKILDEIWEVTIARDIIERWKIRNVKALYLLIKALKASKEFSVHRFYNYLKSSGIFVSKNTLYNYMQYLNDALIVFPLKRYSTSYKDIEKSIPKIYFVDSGLYLDDFDLSRALENIVFIELKRRGFKENKTLFYYKTSNNKEIDFIIRKEDINIIEVAYELDQEHVKKTKKAMEELKQKNGLIITWDEEDIIKENNREIKILPLWKFLTTI